MRAGQLDKRIKIQKPPTGTDGFGQPVRDWAELATVWGSCADLNGREIMAAQAASSRVTSKVIIRYRPDVSAAERLVIGSDVYEIEYVLRGGRNEYLTLMCRRG